MFSFSSFFFQKQLNSLKEEKRQLELQLKREETATKTLLNHVTNKTTAITVNNIATIKPISPPPFTPQKISPVALESLGSHLRSNSQSPDNTIVAKKIIKRDVGVMCIQHTRDASTSVIPQITTKRSIGTNPLNTISIQENLYTNREVEDLIKASLHEYEDRKRILKQRNTVTVGTQMAPIVPPSPPLPPTPQMKNIHVQTVNQIEKITPKISKGVMAVPLQKDVFLMVRPETRTIGCSDDKIITPLCDKCLVTKRSIGCGPDSEETRNYLSLKQMDMPPRSLSFSLGEYEKLPIRRKTVGTQYQKSVQNIGIQNTAIMESIGIQNIVLNQTKGCQYNIEGVSTSTDTEDLILRIHKNVNTDEFKWEQMKPKQKIKCIDNYCNTDLKRTRDYGTLTTSLMKKQQVNASSNTDKILKKDVSCGDIIKPHISIACADNYCDSCKDAIKNLARDFSSSLSLSKITNNDGSGISSSNTTINNNNSSQNQNQNGTKIPRPTTLTSPRTARKLFVRQNTYTISTPSPSPIPDRKIIG